MLQDHKMNIVSGACLVYAPGAVGFPPLKLAPHRNTVLLNKSGKKLYDEGYFLIYSAPKRCLFWHALARLYYIESGITQIPQKPQKFHKTDKDSNLITQMILK